MFSFNAKMSVIAVAIILVLPACKGDGRMYSQRGLVLGIAVDQAAVVGVDYRKALTDAFAGDGHALRQIFKATPHMDGAGATFNSGRLRQLLDKFGDREFSKTLYLESRSVREAVIDALDFQFNVNEKHRDWFREYPITYRLGSHRYARSYSSR